MRGIELLDSKRFCDALDKLCEARKAGDDTKTAQAWDAVAAMAGPVKVAHTPITLEGTTDAEPVMPDAPPKRKGGRPKGAKTKPKPEREPKGKQSASEALADIDRTLTQADRDRIKAQDAANAPVDQDKALDAVIAEVIKPNMATARQADGFRHFVVKLQRPKGPTPTSGHKWIAALKRNGISVDEKLFSCVVEGNGMLRVIF